MELRSSFKDQFMEFKNQDPDNVQPPATFSFLAQYVNKLEKNYQSNPSLFDMNFSPINIGIKPVRYRSPNVKPKPPRPSTAFLISLPDAPIPSAPPKDSNLTPSPSISTTEFPT